MTQPETATDQTALRETVVSAIKASPFQELRAVNHAANGPLQITVKVDDLADVLVRRLAAAVLPASVDRADVLREAADLVAALDRRKLGIAADTIRDAWEEGRDEAAAELRRVAAETPNTTATPDVVAAIVAALQERGGELSELAEEQMRPSLEERAQEWLEAAEVARRAAKAAAAPSAGGVRQPKEA